jgi:hypothetical protein
MSTKTQTKTKTTETAKTAEPVQTASLVPDQLGAKALQLWNLGMDTYYRQGGISDLDSQLSEMRTGANSLSAGLLDLGRECLIYAKNDHRQAGVYFAGATAMAEKQAKADAKAKGIKDVSTAKLLPIWSPNKTTVSKALEKGIDLNRRDDKGHLVYPTITPVRKAIAAPRGTKGAGTQTGPAQFTFTQKLAASVDQLYKELAACNPEGQDRAADDILALAIKVRDTYRAFDPSKQDAPLSGAEPAESATAKRSRAMRGGSR